MSGSMEKHKRQGTGKECLLALIAGCFLAAMAMPGMSSATVTGSTALPQVWRLKSTRVTVDWPNANLGRDPLINARGGEGEVVIRGYGEVCPGQSEHIRFTWSFINKGVTVLRPGEEIEVNLKAKRVSANNPCGGGLAARSYLTIVPSGSAGLLRPQDERFLSKKLGRAGGDPNGDAASASITVNTNENVSYPVASFAIRFSGPCSKGYSCGFVLFVYEYELTTGGAGAFAIEDNVSINQAAIIRYFPLRSASPDECRDACAREPNCVAYTYVRPGAYNAGDPPMCYLLSARGQKTKSSCCVSGEKINP